tara:strand:+ start:789 stop:1157 length:369 start_codon:yes stop_codon:yes gene_type:complete
MIKLVYKSDDKENYPDIDIFDYIDDLEYLKDGCVEDAFINKHVQRVYKFVRAKYAILLSAHGESKAQEYLGNVIQIVDSHENKYQRQQTKEYNMWVKQQNQYTWACPSTGSSVVSGGKVSPR